MDRNALRNAKTVFESSGQYLYIGKLEFPFNLSLLQSRFPEDCNSFIDMLVANLKNRLYACITARGVIKAKKTTKVDNKMANAFFTWLREFDSKLSMLQEVPKFYYLVAFDR